jgi:hypothetical protein
MTTETNHSCPTCGTALDWPAPQAPEPARKPYMIEYHAPAGVFRDLISAETPPVALRYAQDYRKDLRPRDFEPDENAARIQEIIVATQSGDIVDTWTDLDYFAEKHAAEILDYLQTIIDAADGLTEKRRELDETISEITSCAEDAARRLDALRVQGGAQ